MPAENKKPRIALAQIKYSDTSEKDNSDKIIQYIQLAKEANADIVCFPESCLHKTEVFHFTHETINKIRQECKKHSIYCILTEDFNIRSGTLSIRKKKYNIAILIDRTGKIAGWYRKIHLFGDELNPGKKIGVFQTDFAKIGIVICWDLAFPELFREMKKLGTQIVFCPAQWWYEEEAHDNLHKKREIKLLEALIRTRAFENLFFVALCNPVMESQFQVSYSAVAAPHKLVGRLIDKEGLVVADIDLNEIQRLTKIYKS